MVEFSLTIGLLLMCIMSSIAAAIWSIEGESAVTAAELTARLSIAARGVGAGQADQVDTAKAVATTAAPYRLLAASMFGSTVKTRTSGCAATSPYALGITLCSEATGVGATLKVTVHVYGCAKSVVPTPIGGCTGGVKIDQMAVVHPPVFQQ